MVMTILNGALEGVELTKKRTELMKLYGRYLSPFVRRVAVSLNIMQTLGPNMRLEIESASRLQSRVSERIDYAGGYNAWIQYVDRRID